MSTRRLLVLPLVLALAACGSSQPGDSVATAPAPVAATSVTAPQTTPTAADTATAPASAGSSADTQPAAATATEPTVASASASDAMMTAADQAARTQAAKDFVDNGQWVAGKDYFVIEPRQPKVTSSNKIEVVEVFSYGCPACNAAHGAVDKLRQELPDYAVMAYLPASFNPQENWVLYQRAYLAAKALGVATKSYDAFFDATWKSGELATYNLGGRGLKPKSEWPTLDDVAKFYTQYGVSAKQFEAVANSFAINTQMKRADKLVKDYGVPATPTIVINGHYRFTFSDVGSYEKGIELAKWLIAKEAAGS